MDRILSRPAQGIALALALAASSVAQSSLTVEPIVTGFGGPTFVTAPDGDAERLFITELNTGLVRIVQDGVLLPTPFLDVSAASSLPLQQLYSMAFHPDYDQNGLFFVYYVGSNGGSMLERFQVSAVDPNIADPSSGLLLISTSFPVAGHAGHGAVFGPDGLLYVAIGNGNNMGTPSCISQDPSSMLGKILRIDVDSGAPYAIPPDNPFLGVPGYLPEIWAIGLRNPWRMSFDRLTGDLYIGDVGQSQREEINFEPAGFAGGRNYGWAAQEGSLPIAGGCPPGTPPHGDPAYTRPIYEYDHGMGCSVTGGYVYRGADIPSLYGTYFFGDFCANEIQGIWSFRYSGCAVTNFVNRAPQLQPETGGPIDQLATFGEDGVGELYVADLGGSVYKIVRECGFETYCETTPNSTGLSARAIASGSARIASNELILTASNLPANQFGHFFMSSTRDFVPLFGGSQGNLCVAPPIYRFADDIWNSGPSGSATFYPDLVDLPPGVMVRAGDTWYFQAWFRDRNPTRTSNTTNGASVRFCP
ncbi:MAG: PQQ-dependent sugar dehydrogenase [bacterium]|nr:PQQ-dependent sugar dehydrogenase [bacterium]